MNNNASYLPPRLQKKKHLHKHCFQFLFWTAGIPRGNEKTKVMQNLAGGGGANKVHYRRCTSGV